MENILENDKLIKANQPTGQPHQQQQQQQQQRKTDATTKTVNIPEEVAGQVIGKGGNLIWEIKDKNNVQTNIQNNNNKTIEIRKKETCRESSPGNPGHCIKGRVRKCREKRHRRMKTFPCHLHALWFWFC